MSKLTSENDFADMTKDQAQIIRALRLTGCTWGRISELVNPWFSKDDYEWGQIDGKELVQTAEKIWNEDFDEYIRIKPEKKRNE